MIEKLRTDDVFKDFIGRDDALRSVARYSLYPVMLYRSNLYTHSHRVAALVRAIHPTAQRVFGTNYDPTKAELLALVHDDAETLFGDIQAGNKRKMTPKQLAEIKAAEATAIHDLAKRSPQAVGGHSYLGLLLDAMNYDSIESQIVCYADKYDALGEALHEIHAGNHHFVTNVTNEYGRIPTPPEYYAEFFANFPAKYPALSLLLAEHLPLFEPVPESDYRPIVTAGKPHTASSILLPADNHHYATWRKIVINDTNDEVVCDLYIPKEALN